MQTNNLKYLKFVRFKEVENWSVQYVLDNTIKFNNKYSTQKIGNFLHRNKTAIDVQDGHLYKRVTIKTNNGGCCLRDKELGDKIGTKQQFLIKKGQFIVSKIDARNGAFGVVPHDCDGSIITGNFWTFDVDKSLVDTTYLSLTTTTKQFIKFAEKASNGTTNRHYLQEDLFLNVKIPLPTLTEQESLVSAYNAKIAEAEAKEAEAEKKSKEIEEYLLSELGIATPKLYKTNSEASFVVSEPAVEYVVNITQKQDDESTYHWDNEIKKEYTYLQFVKYKDVEKWGVDKIIGNNKDLLFSTKFSNHKLREIIEINPTTSFTEIKDDDEISFIPMECISDEYGMWKEKRTCKKQDSKAYTKFAEGDLIWARITPCMQNGKSAIVTGLINGIGCGSTEFHVLRNKNKKLNTTYVHNILRLPIVLEDAKKSFTGSAGQQRVPKSYLEQLSIPLPPLEIQNAIVAHISEQKEQIKQLKQEAKELRESALKEFENEIFG